MPTVITTFLGAERSDGSCGLVFPVTGQAEGWNGWNGCGVQEVVGLEIPHERPAEDANASNTWPGYLDLSLAVIRT